MVEKSSERTPQSQTEQSTVEDVYLEHAFLLRRIAIGKFGLPDEEAETLVHDLFIEYLVRPREVQHNARTYLIAAVCNASRNYWRAERQTTVTEPHVSEERLMALAGEPWLIEEEIRTRRGVRAIADFAARIESEDAAAPALLEELRERLARDPDFDVTADSRFLTGGVFRALDQYDLEQTLIDPFFSERLTRVACTLAEALPDDYYPANAVFQVRGRAWMMHANSCAHIARYAEAFEDANRAQQAYEHLKDPGTGLAAVALTRAVIYLKTRQPIAGLPLARSAADEYERRGDRQRHGIAVEIAAALLDVAGEYASALKVALGSLQTADELRDAEMRARILHGAGILYRRVGDLDNAGKSLLEALHIWEGLGMKAAVVQCRWSIALVALARADFHDAAQMLRATVNALREIGAKQDEADAKLDLAEALLMLGRLQEIETLCTEAEAAYRKLGVVTGRLAAAGYLRNAAANQMLRREDVEHVRTYLEQVREKPDTPFGPPRKKGPASEH